MQSFIYEMPTKVIFGRDIFSTQATQWKGYGKRALIATGAHSAKSTGALDKVIDICTAAGQEYVVFDHVQPNPHTRDMDMAADFGRKHNVDFVVGIGGGSAMDAAKVTAILLKHPETKAIDLCKVSGKDGLPVICIPTTAGTGSEVTPFAVMTADEISGQKQSTKVRLYPNAAWIDPAFTDGLPLTLRRITAVDALCQLIEGTLTTRAQPFTTALAMEGLHVLGGCMDALLNGSITAKIADKLIYAACLSGMVISQTGISLPHIMSYNLTDNYKYPHGQACGALLAAYLKAYPDKSAVHSILAQLGIESLDTLDAWLKAVIGTHDTITASMLDAFVEDVYSQAERIKSFPGIASRCAIRNLYLSALSLERT